LRRKTSLVKAKLSYLKFILKQLLRLWLFKMLLFGQITSVSVLEFIRFVTDLKHNKIWILMSL
jgi:hypothetical protein